MSISDQQLKTITDELTAVYGKKGSIGSEELCDKLEKINATLEQVESIYKALEDAKIEIVDEYDRTKDLYDEISKEISMDDPVKMYLKDIGKYTLLSTEEEIVLAEK